MLRCCDGSVYTGITNDVDRRMSEHFSGNGAAAKYTRSHAPLRLEAVWQSESRSQAAKLEARIKRLDKPHKEALINGETLEIVPGIDIKSYKRCK